MLDNNNHVTMKHKRCKIINYILKLDKLNKNTYNTIFLIDLQVI